ncbi:TPA: cytochrome b [Klebsiella quasipneumoniae subsp. similipneumoniae]|nr:cytochrome b [Klebsiella quasipneumoniae subsp. similipneumoniae]HBT4828852.1 cytochrome b [Klebsiella quasipneumoniae subsp. similipneumoniae]
MKENKYAWQQVVLHWISAVVIIWATVTGFWVAFSDASPKMKAWVGFFNVSLTTVFIPLFILRIYYFVRFHRPNKGKRNLTNRIAVLVHMILYINIAVVLLTGVLMMDRDINVFHLMTIPRLIENEVITDLFFTQHIISCFTLAGLVLLHILAVIKHELSGRKILRKMTL